MKSSILFLLALISNSAMSQVSSEKIFTLEKSFNSENILVVHTQTNESCKFVEDSNGYLDFYWLMDGKEKKPVHPMIRSKVQDRVKYLGMDQAVSSFKIRLNDLSEIKHDLEDTTVEVKAEIINGNCEVKSILKLGASAQYRKLSLKRTYCEVESNMLGIPKGCKYLELIGLDTDTGAALKIRFQGK